MRTDFLLSKSLTSENYAHIICTNPIAIYSLPGYELISGDTDPQLLEKAIEWHSSHKDNKVHVPKLIPKGYQEAFEKLRNHKNDINVTELASKIGVSERVLKMSLDGELYNRKPIHMNYGQRVRFLDIFPGLGL